MAQTSRRRGRPPSLSRRGAWVGAGAVVLATGGLVLGSADLLGLGIVLCGLLFVVIIAHYPAAVFVWRRHVELAWRVARPSGDPTLYANRPLELTVELRNRAPRGLGIAAIDPIVSPALDVDSARLPTPPESEAAVTLSLRPKSVGLALLHGASITLTDALGLTHIEAYFPSPIALPILPRPGHQPAMSTRHALGPERTQRAASPKSGQGGDLRELRDHRPGDPWKQIAWKATARRGRLMVRELERETQTTHLFILDVSGRMRRGPNGSTPLDVAIEVTTRLVRGALEAGDRVGLSTVDGRVVSASAPSDRPGHRGRLVELLAQAPASYDEDLTDLSDAELCATVARYLLLQEGEETRVAAPPVDDPRWGGLVAGPNGELFELGKLVFAVDQSRQRHRALAQIGRAALPRAGDPQMATLRVFCRERAIPLPIRDHAGRGVEGIVAALAPNRERLPDRIVIVSMLDGIGQLPALDHALREALTRLRRRGTKVLWVAPTGAPLIAHTDELTTLLDLEHRRERQELRTRGASLGLFAQPCEDALRFHLDVRAPRRASRVA